MKWGDRNERGCIDAECGNLHPLICDKSLDLKCFAKTCPHKLHTLKCKRISAQSDNPWPGGPPEQAHHQKKIRKKSNGKTSPNINPWQVKPDHSYQGQVEPPNQGGKQHAQPTNDQGFQDVTVQPRLEAFMFKMRQEMWEEVRVLRTFLAREIQLAQQVGLRPSF